MHAGMPGAELLLYVEHIFPFLSRCIPCVLMLGHIPLVNSFACVCYRPALMVTQKDVTGRAELEAHVAQLTETQLVLLTQIFPRHIIEFLSVTSPEMLTQRAAQLARAHQQVWLICCLMP